MITARPLFLLCPTRKGSLKTPGALLENLYFFLCCLTVPSGFQAPSSSCPHTHSDFFILFIFIIINFFFFLPGDIRQDTFLGQTGKAVISWQRAWSCCKVVSHEQSLRCGVLLGLCLSWAPWESTTAANGTFQRTRVCAVDYTSFSFPGSGRKFCSTFKSQRIPVPFEKVLQVSLGISGIVIEKILLSRPYLSLGPMLLLLVTLVTLRGILFLLCYVLVLESVASAWGNRDWS